MRRIVDLFNENKSPDVFIIIELVTRLKEFLTKIKTKYENLVQKKRALEKLSEKTRASYNQTNDNNREILKVIVEDKKEFESSEKSKESDSKAQVGN